MDPLLIAQLLALLAVANGTPIIVERFLHVRENAEELLPGVIWCGSALEAAEKADIAVVVTEWNEFRALDLNTLKGRMRGDVLVDLRNIYLPAQARAAGFNYTSVGQGQPSKSIATSIPEMIARLQALPVPPSIEERDDEELPEPLGL